MQIYYKKATLYISNDQVLNKEILKAFKKRLLRIINDYGIKNIIITFKETDNKLILDFKRDLTKFYHGYLLIKKN